MPNDHPRLLVTGASGQLGRLVLDQLRRTAPAGTVSGAARRPDALAALKAQGVDLRRADYADPSSLDAALAGIDRLLLISSSEVGGRAPQHRNVIEAARRAAVGLIVYTSVLHADDSPLGLAAEHRDTEAALRDSGVPFVVLRNGWYTENYAMALAPALKSGTLYGSAGDGRVSAASRADYAAAAAAALTTAEDWSGRAFELAGDEGFTLAEFAAELGRQGGTPVAYRDLPQADYKAALLGAGLPDPLAGLLADSDAGIAKGALFDDGRALSLLIGRPTTPWRTTLAAMLKRD